ncbi:MAG TPA: exopolysaccharide biosynthesis polyprenyl glycosylphosphotransferase [Gaiellaceae bacterium]|jgi:exopolysaccharide biosynthesis polyprenyl glycosylphosphotransferase|nr:exopolysaccharide biosynthesis polyprenyl glycosylphosphotransferase [Gaiellaceae bacterium]
MNAARQAEDVRAARPYFLAASPLKSGLRRLVSILALLTIDVLGLVVGLYAALALRAYTLDPHPVIWGLLWDQEVKWLAFLILLLVLVFWRAGLYAPRELREGVGRVLPSVILVAALALAFAIGTGQHFTTFGLYIVGAVFVATLIAVLRSSYELVTGLALRAAGVRRRALLVGPPEAREHLRRSLGTSRGGIAYEFAGEVEPGLAVEDALLASELDEILVADTGVDETRLLEIVEAAHRRNVRVRIAPRTTELLVERGEYVPGQGVPLFELRPPIFAGTDWATKRVFDVVVSSLVVIVGLPVWLLIAAMVKLTSPGPVFYADPRIGLGEREFRMLKFRTMVAGAERRQAELEARNEAGGALFKIRDDPRVTPFGRVLRRLSLDEVPNVLNVLRGEMSLVGPRPLPVRDYERLEPWHRRRYNVLPGVTGLWQVAGRSDLTFDDLVRLDFYYLENWSLWLDITILFKTPFAVIAKRGAY